MNNISLYIGEYLLGNLLAGNSKYYFTANAEGIDRARQKHPIEMLLFQLNDNGMAEYDKLPELFAKYINAADRKDLMQLSGINSTDSDYEKLYKLAGLTLEPAPFIIKQA